MPLASLCILPPLPGAPGSAGSAVLGVVAGVVVALVLCSVIDPAFSAPCLQPTTQSARPNPRASDCFNIRDSFRVGPEVATRRKLPYRMGVCKPGPGRERCL